MELFSKEADGRIPKGPLYSIVKQELHPVSYTHLDVYKRQLSSMIPSGVLEIGSVAEITFTLFLESARL